MIYQNQHLQAFIKWNLLFKNLQNKIRSISWTFIKQNISYDEIL
jgi:hypothetical protein